MVAVMDYREYVVDIKRVEHGTVVVKVPVDATRDDIIEAAKQAESDGMALIFDSDVDVTYIKESKRNDINNR